MPNYIHHYTEQVNPNKIQAEKSNLLASSTMIESPMSSILNIRPVTMATQFRKHKEI
jgi:hypothetical protein